MPPTINFCKISRSLVLPFHFSPEGEIIEQFGDIDHLGSNEFLVGRVVDFDYLVMKEPPEHVSSTAVHQASAKADNIVSKHVP
jgi:hypothetical protein